ncbi:Hypothetical protein CINCED_3A021968 [Cinara cedri]|uniref:Uncharacterized protein n=1 Tax=Cinara cedri TaxID=506608 RepID=A0A5E4MJ84_9HEMI|nr:Hypothetical protein CINCED_3A021968 [Cinara cedri]
MSNLRKINKDRLIAFLKHLESKNTGGIYSDCLCTLKTLLYTSPNFSYDTALNTHTNVQTFFNSINFEAIEPEHIIKLKPILYQAADIDVYARYIKSILNKNDKICNPILMDIWTQLGLRVLKLPIFIHEKCIEVNPVIFEKTILSAISLWQVQDLIDICFKSPLVFQTCSSIFNELLIKLNFSDRFIDFLVNFINNFCSLCEENNIDFIDFYPTKCKSVLILRAISKSNSSELSKCYLNEEVKKLVLNFPKESICLFSHFPDLYLPI